MRYFSLFLTPNVQSFPTPLLQLSDTHYLESAPDSISARHYPPAETPIPSPRATVQLTDQLQGGSSNDLSLEWLTELRKALYYYRFTKKDTIQNFSGYATLPAPPHIHPPGGFTVQARLITSWTTGD